jgi:hypothetical protein
MLQAYPELADPSYLGFTMNIVDLSVFPKIGHHLLPRILLPFSVARGLNSGNALASSLDECA